MKAVAAIGLLLALGACQSPQRAPFSVTGQITLSDGSPIRESYRLILREGRKDRGGIGSIFAAVAIIDPAKDGSFSYSGYVCPDVALMVPYGRGINAPRRAPVWDERIEIRFQSSQLAELEEGSVDENILRSARREISELDSDTPDGDRSSAPC